MLISKNLVLLCLVNQLFYYIIIATSMTFINSIKNFSKGNFLCIITNYIWFLLIILFNKLALLVINNSNLLAQKYT